MLQQLQLLLFLVKLIFVLNCSLAFPNETSPVSLQTVMFIPTLESQTSPEQKEKWLPKAMSYEIIGTFAQTELGHGNYLVIKYCLFLDHVRWLLRFGYHIVDI